MEAYRLLEEHLLKQSKVNQPKIKKRVMLHLTFLLCFIYDNLKNVYPFPSFLSCLFSLVFRILFFILCLHALAYCFNTLKYKSLSQYFHELLVTEKSHLSVFPHAFLLSTNSKLTITNLFHSCLVEYLTKISVFHLSLFTLNCTGTFIHFLLVFNHEKRD